VHRLAAGLGYWFVIRYHFDLYPRDDPRDGARVVRFTKLQSAEYRGEANGTGSGRFSIRADVAEAQLIDPRGLQYVRVVREDTVAVTEAVVGGFWLETGDFTLLDEQGTRLLSFGGAGTLAYLSRAIMWSHTYISPIFTGQDPIGGVWNLWAQSTVFANGNYLGAMLWRVLYEAQHLTPGAHKHADTPAGSSVSDTHDDDRPEIAIPDMVFDFDQYEDSNGNDWTISSGEFKAQVGENVLAVVKRLMEAGLYVSMDPDTFELSAFQAATHRRDRTGVAWGASVVRFQRPTGEDIATGNIKSDAKRAIHAYIKRSVVLAGGGSDVYGIDTGASDIPWEGFYYADVNDVDAAENIASVQIGARDDAGDTLRIRGRLGTAVSSGYYRPFEDALLDDLATVHTGSNQFDLDEQDFPIAAITVNLRPGGDWDVWYDLGSSYSANPSRNFQVSPVPAHNHTIPLCTALTPGTESLFRFYASSDPGDAGPAAHGSWDVDSRAGNGGTSGVNSLTTAPDSSYGSGGTGITDSDGGDADGVNILYWAGMNDASIGASLAAALAAGGATIRGQFPAKTRTGLGIDEEAQYMTSNIALRVTQGNSSTVRGTALAPHALTSVGGSARWSRSGSFFNRSFPAADASTVLTAVPGTVSTDRIVAEVGSRNYTLDDSGGHILFTSDSAADLPEDESSPAGDNGWIEIRAISAPSGSGLHPDLVGTDNSAARCDHKHHILANRAPTTADNITQGYPTTTLWTNTETSLTYLLIDEDAGTWILIGTAGEHTHDASEIEGGGDSTGAHSHPDLSEAGDGTTAIGGHNWIQEPRAVAYRDRVYKGDVHGDSGDVTITVFNSADPTTAPIEKVLHAALETDIHNNATSLVRASDKKLLTLYCGHVLANIYTRLSTTSLDTDPDLDDGFAAETNIDASLGSLSYTYPSIHQLTGETNDPIYIFYREGNANGGDWYYHTSTDSGATWSARTMILTQAAKSPYLKVVPNGDSRLDFIAMDEHPLDGPNSVYHFYYEGGAFHTSDGSALTLPATNANMTEVYDGSTSPAWIWDIAIGTDGQPRLAYSVWDGGTDHTYYYATLSGSAWTSEEVATAADGEIISEVPGGIALDRTDPTIAYLARQADGEIEIFRATRISGTWTLDPVTANSATQNQYPAALHNPYPETRTGHAIRAVYLYGTYTGEDVWDLDIGLVTASSGGASSVALSDATPLVESGSGDAGVGTEASRDDHVHPAAGGGTPPAILLESGHATPFTFDEILQESDGSDFLWASE
jgi:hypothetical protein